MKRKKPTLVISKRKPTKADHALAQEFHEGSYFLCHREDFVVRLRGTTPPRSVKRGKR